MVAILSKEDLLEKSLKQLKAHVKALQTAGYPIDYDSIKADAHEQDDEAKFLRMKIRHAQRDPPKKTKPPKAKPASPKAKSPGKVGRAAELNKLSLRSKNKEMDLMTMAKDLNVTGRTKMKKDDLISAIIIAEKKSSKPPSEETGEIAPKKKSKSKTPKVKPPSEEEEEIVPKKKSKSKTPKVKPPSEEEEEIVPKKKSKSKTPKVKPPSEEEEIAVSKNCGEFSHDELLNKRLDELRKLLKSKGIDASGVDNKEQAADIFCQFSKYEESCGEDNGFKCGDDRVCDVSVNPGVCVSKNVAVGEPSWLEYKGRQIVGSKDAINALRKKLGLNKYQEPDPLSKEGITRSKLLKRAGLVSGKTDKDFKRMSNKQLEHFIEGYDIKEKKSKSKLIKQLAKNDKSDLSDLSVQELQHRAKLIGKKANKLKNREENLEMLAAWLHRDPSEFQKWSDTELEQRLVALREWQHEEGENRQDMINDLSGWMKDNPSNFKDWSDQDLKQRLEGFREFQQFQGKNLAKKKKQESEKVKPAKKPVKQESSSEEEVVKPAKKPVKQESSSEEEVVKPAKKPVKQESSSEEEVVKPVKKPAKKPVKQESSSEEEVVKPVKKPKSSSEEEVAKASSSEEETPIERKKQEDISHTDVERVLADVMAGKQGKIEELSQVQNTVLKCLGLISA
jgi:hypothetical protein